MSSNICAKRIGFRCEVSEPGRLGISCRSRTYWPCGVRCIGGVNLIRAFAGNLRTWLAMVREHVQVDEPRGRKYRCANQGRTAP